MANFAYSNTILSTSMSSFTSVPTLANEWLDVADEISSLSFTNIDQTGVFSSESNASGTKETWTNPSINTNFSDTEDNSGNPIKPFEQLKTMTGSFVLSGNADAGYSTSLKASKFTATDADGDTLTVIGTISATNNDAAQTVAYTLNKISMSSGDGSKYEINGKITYSYAWKASSPESYTEKYSVAVTSFKSTDASDNVLTVTGNLKYDYKANDVLSYDMDPLDFTSGTITGLSANIDGQKIVATRLNLTYDDFADLGSNYTIEDLLPLALSGNDTLTVSATDSLGTDTVFGYAGNDKITGSASADIIDGDEGNDNLIGGAGADVLIGGAGKDMLTGGTDADTFSFAAFADLGTDTKTRDTIKDFKTADADKIDLSGMGSFTWGGSAAPTSDATNLVWFTRGVVYISTDADVAAEYQIALTGVNTLAASDFTGNLSLT